MADLDLDRIEAVERLYAERGDYSSLLASAVLTILARLRAAEAALAEAPVCEVCGEAQDGRVWGDVEVCRGCYEGARHSLQVDHERQRAETAEAARVLVSWLPQEPEEAASLAADLREKLAALDGAAAKGGGT